MVSLAEARRSVAVGRDFPNVLIGNAADRPAGAGRRGPRNPFPASLAALCRAPFPAAGMGAPAFPSLASLAPQRPRVRGTNLTEA
jgi:hypothetical protein